MYRVIGSVVNTRSHSFPGHNALKCLTLFRLHQGILLEAHNH